MISIEKFLPSILPYANGLPKVVARQSLIKVAQKLYTHSLLWQETIEPIVVDEPEVQIELDSSENVTIVRIMEVYLGNVRLWESNQNMMAQNRTTNWREEVATPKSYVYLGNGKLRLYPAPDRPVKLTIVVALMPSSDATELPDDMYNRYLEVLSQGVLADVKQMEGQPWSAPEQAVAYLGMFNQGVRDARVEADRSQGRTTGRIKPLRIV